MNTFSAADTFVLVDDRKPVFIVCDGIYRATELTWTFQMCDRIIRTCFGALSALLTLGGINMGTKSSRLNSPKLTCVDTCFTKAVLAVLRHGITGNRTILTGRIDNLDNISIILNPRSLPFRQTYSLTDDFSFLVDTASKLWERSRNQSLRNMISFLVKLPFKSKPRHFS